mmetsp:Transcript_25870/g.56713  ORF Transcript_25870/g.56713 Transcript_25870/m.56713 type:complete len:325 (-) Transcript_25870:399-1373(-)
MLLDADFFFFLFWLPTFLLSSLSVAAAASRAFFSSSSRSLARSIPNSCPYAGCPASMRMVSYSKAPASIGPSTFSSPMRCSHTRCPNKAALDPDPKKTNVYPTQATAGISVDGSTKICTSPSLLSSRGFQTTPSELLGKTISLLFSDKFACSSRIAFWTCLYCVEASEKENERLLLLSLLLLLLLQKLVRATSSIGNTKGSNRFNKSALECPGDVNTKARQLSSTMVTRRTSTKRPFASSRQAFRYKSLLVLIPLRKSRVSFPFKNSRVPLPEISSKPPVEVSSLVDRFQPMHRSVVTRALRTASPRRDAGMSGGYPDRSEGVW